MADTNDISNVPRLQLDGQKDLLLYAMKIVQGDSKSFINDYYQKQEGSRYNYKNKNQSKIDKKKRNGRKSRKKKKKSKRKKKKHKKSSRNNKKVHLSNKGSASSSFLPIVVLNSDTKTEKDSRVSKSEPRRKKYWGKRRRHRPEIYDRDDYYDEYSYEYPPPFSSSWYRHRRTIPMIRPRHGYNMESGISESRYNPIEIRREEHQGKDNRYIFCSRKL
jgi:hypothetical protein